MAREFFGIYSDRVVPRLGFWNVGCNLYVTLSNIVAGSSSPFGPTTNNRIDHSRIGYPSETGGRSGLHVPDISRLTAQFQRRVTAKNFSLYLSMRRASNWVLLDHISLDPLDYVLNRWRDLLHQWVGGASTKKMTAYLFRKKFGALI